jgi:hypothetical protein
MPVRAPVAPAEKPTENLADNQQSTVAQPEVASPVATPPATSEKSGSEKRTASDRPAVINLLSPENGGHIIVADNDRWLGTIDGDEKNMKFRLPVRVGPWAVYGFPNDASAMFDTFKVLILGAESWNLKEFELLAGNDSATGKFESIGKFQTQNFRFFKDPYQEFKFPTVKARYLKVKVISSHGDGFVGVYEFQLLGVLDR